ncbi:1-acyl-sn-glycerol-3-phosphate acyltransferase [Neolewinella sp.]|uniref:1-acyl-sn-glycerol-3-phosphate acyltransferase n=1 Tax=Neolewinella sp. TaxID=2993543 RepID=UPI003B52DA3E
MLYYLVRPVARYVLRYYYRHIDLAGLEHIPPEAAVILASNHPTAFIEPCILACFQPRSLHFLARGDLYKNKLAIRVLRALHILPVYRMQDGGYGKLTENYATFEACYKVLSRRRALMILAEGRCINEKRLRPLKKGTARIALGALDRDTTLPEVYIVPVGVNFVAAERVRSTVMIRCGKPLLASQYLQTYRENEAMGLRALTEDLREALSEHVLQLPAAADDALYEAHLQLVRNELPPLSRSVTHGGVQLATELAVVASGRPDERVLTYTQRLQHLGITDRDLLTSGATEPMPWLAFLALFLLIPQLPLWLIAEIIALGGPRTVEFYSPVRFAAVAVGTVVSLLALLVLSWAGKLYFALSLLLNNWSLRQLEAWRQWRGRRRAQQLDPELRAELLTLRQDLL